MKYNYKKLLGRMKEKEYTQEKLATIIGVDKATLNLKLNKKSRYYPSRLGCDFCGYILYNDYKLIRKRSIKGMRDKICDFKKGIVSFEEIELSFVSWCGHARHANSYKVMSDFYGFIYK